MSEPGIERSLTLNFIGDWGQANFHRICSWLTQEFCDRAGPESRTAIWSLRHGGIETAEQIHNGEAQMGVLTPAMMLGDALTGTGMFAGRPMPDLRAIGVLPQNDRLVLAIDPKFGISSFAELREKKPPLRIAASTDDGTNFIGFVTRHYMAAHGIDEPTLTSWGGEYVTNHRPEQALFLMRDGLVDAVVQEAIMTPWWRAVIARGAVPLPAEEAALATLEAEFGYGRNSLPAGFWDCLGAELPTLDFSDFVLAVRSDLPDDVAYLLSWCLVETREAIERQYHHIPPERSPLSYPLEPQRMARPSLPLHPGAERYYREAGHL